MATLDGSVISFGSHTSNAFKPYSKRKVPPPRPRFEKSSSHHMLPTSNLTPNKSVFSSKHRLVKRNLPFFQSKNHLQVTNQHSEFRLFNLLRHDWFHVGLRVNVWLSLFLLLGVWTIAIIIFAGIYMHIDASRLHDDCGLGPREEPIQFSPAFAFSLETCTTVGYGLPNDSNSFFEGGCTEVQVAIYFQMVWSMLFNAFLFAFFFARIAKSEARGVQVIFSNKAIISNRPDVPFPCFQFRVFDVDGSFPVVEAHVRIYVVTQKSPIPIPLRVVIPNDDSGSMLMLSMPSQVVHAMDAYSPLVPRSKIKCATSVTVPGDGLHLRQVDSSTNNRDDVICPVCGESYGTVERLVKHGKYQKMVESHDEYDVKGSHQEIDWDELAGLLKKSTEWSLQQLQAFFRNNISEVVCIVEGIDPLASGTFQAIHSYQFQDINFSEAHFADCVCLNGKEELVVDLDFFHQIRPNVPFVDSERSTNHGTNHGDEFHDYFHDNEDEINHERRANANANEIDNDDFHDHQENEPPTPTAITSGSANDNENYNNNGQDHSSISATFAEDTTPQEPLERPREQPQEQQTPLALSQNILRHVSTPDDLRPTEQEEEEDGSLRVLEPRHLLYNQQSQTPPKGAPPAVQSFVPAPQPHNLTTQSAHTPLKAVPGTKPRRYSTGVTDYDEPPPLFTLADDLKNGKINPQPTGRQPTGRQKPTTTTTTGSRHSMPGNMMNSLVTGKF